MISFATDLLHVIELCLKTSYATYLNAGNNRLWPFIRLRKDAFLICGIRSTVTCRYQSLTHFALSRLVFEDILVAKLKNKCPPSVPVKEEQPKFEGAQENVLQYVAGYVPFKLQKTYMKRDAKEAAAVVNCLLAYTTEVVYLKLVMLHTLLSDHGDACEGFT